VKFWRNASWLFLIKLKFSPNECMMRKLIFSLLLAIFTLIFESTVTLYDTNVIPYGPLTIFVVRNASVFVTKGDFNNDDKLALAVILFHNRDVTILLGQGDGAFRKLQRYTAGFLLVSIATGDAWIFYRYNTIYFWL